MDPDPTPDLETLTSTEALLEMGEVIEGSREYFTSVCDGIGVQAEGELAYTYIFTLTRDGEPGFWDKIFGSAPMTFDHHITNDVDHEIWIPQNRDVMPPDWASGVQAPYRAEPISNVRTILSAGAEYIKTQLETARSNADGIANMQAEDFDAIGTIATALGTQNEQLQTLIQELSTAGSDAQDLKENIENNWPSDGSRTYASRIGDSKAGLIELSEASESMKGANVTVATHVGELMHAVMALWKARIDGMDEAASSIMGGVSKLVTLLKKPTVMGILTEVLGVVVSVIQEMATRDVEDRMSKLEDLGDMANKLQPIEAAETAAGEVSFPTLPEVTDWSPN